MRIQNSTPHDESESPVFSSINRELIKKLNLRKSIYIAGDTEVQDIAPDDEPTMDIIRPPKKKSA